MTRRALLVALVVAAGLALTLAVLARRAHAREQAMDAAVSRLASTMDELDRVRRLSGQRERVAAAQRPKEDLITEVSAALRRAGLPAQSLEGLVAEGDVPLLDRSGESTGLVRQSMRLTLRDLELPQLGAFLEAWHGASPWVPTRIELTRRAGAQERYEVGVTLTAVYRGGRQV